MISNVDSYSGHAVFESQPEGKEIRNVIETIRILTEISSVKNV
jgi:hypothetical protein